MEEPLVEKVNTEADQQPIDTKLDFPRLSAAILANGLLRIASSTEGVLIGFYLAYLAKMGRPVDALLLGTLGVVINASELISAIPIGILTDRIPIRAILVGGALLGAVASQLFGFTGLIVIFYISRALEGISNASSSPPLLVHLTDITQHDPTTRGRVMSFFQVSLLTGIALGGLLAGVLWTALRIYAFSVLAGIYLLVAVLFYWGVSHRPASSTATGQSPARPQTPKHALTGFYQALSDPLVRRLAPAWVAMNAIVGLWLTHVSFQLSGLPISGQYLTGRFTPRQVGMILLVYAVTFALGVTLWGLILARMDRLQALRISLVAMLFVCLWLFLLNRPFIWTGRLHMLVLPLAGLSVFIGSGFTPAALSYLADVVAKKEGRGSAMGLYTFLFGLGNLLGAALGGLLARRYAFNGLVLGTVMLAAVALAAVALLSRPPAAQSPIQEIKS
ncbi:MAG: MFS transporter [Anaerolineaceae bacterium]|nr:MFS transporter [Anaerolineaceae bacterium]